MDRPRIYSLSGWLGNKEYVFATIKSSQDNESLIYNTLKKEWKKLKSGSNNDPLYITQEIFRILDSLNIEYDVIDNQPILREEAK